jgi:hypothetical protein
MHLEVGEIKNVQEIKNLGMEIKLRVLMNYVNL